MTFQEWLFNKYLTWQAEQGSPRTETDFADYLGVKQQSLSAWMRGYYKPRGYKAVTQLYKMYGPEALVYLESDPKTPDQLVQPVVELVKAVMSCPEELRDLVVKAIEKTAEEGERENIEERFIVHLKEVVDRTTDSEK